MSTKTHMLQTSLEAYAALKDNLSPRQEEVLEIIEEAGPTGISNRLIALKLSWPINCVTGRVKELRQKGRVEAAQFGSDSVTHKRVIYWRATK